MLYYSLDIDIINILKSGWMFAASSLSHDIIQLLSKGRKAWNRYSLGTYGYIACKIQVIEFILSYILFFVSHDSTRKVTR